MIHVHIHRLFHHAQRGPAVSCLHTSCLRKSQSLGPTARRYTTTVTSEARSNAQGIDRSNSLKRSYLYVPASSSRMLDKSLSTQSDVIIYDLEDSVPPSIEQKTNARTRLEEFLSTNSRAVLPDTQRVAVRLNSIDTPFFNDDIATALRLPIISTLVLPKIHSPRDLNYVSRKIHEQRRGWDSSPPVETVIQLVASIESAKAVFNVGGIAGWRSEHGPTTGGVLSALLFAAEDYCADTSIIRTHSRRELLYSRSQIANTASAFGLHAIDMVCINFRDPDFLRDESQDGRELGYTGKQAIHPAQVDIIQSTFVPTAKEIARAARIVHYMQHAHSNERGAIGLALEGGGEEMIDAPMIKQAENTIRIARAAGVDIPPVTD